MSGCIVGSDAAAGGPIGGVLCHINDGHRVAGTVSLPIRVQPPRATT